MALICKAFYFLNVKLNKIPENNHEISITMCKNTVPNTLK